MKRLQIVLIYFCFMQVCFANPYFISKKEISAKGMHYKSLEPINLSYDGKYFAALERVKNIKKKYKGITRILRIFRFENKKLVKVDALDIPIFHRSHATLGSKRNKNELMIVGNHGTKYMKVDVEKMTLNTVFQHREGKAGFKGDSVIFSHGGKFYISGWRYDRKQYSKGNEVAYIKTSKRGKTRFVKKIDISNLFHKKYLKIGYVQSFCYISGEHFLFNVVNPKKKETELKWYKHGKVRTLAKGYLLHVFIGTEKKVFYTIKGKKTEDHFIKDVKSNKVWRIGKKNVHLTYPFFSQDGKTFVIIKINWKSKTFNAYYGKEKNGYRLKVLFKKVPIGPMKLSGDGKMYFVMTPKGFKYGYIK